MEKNLQPFFVSKIVFLIKFTVDDVSFSYSGTSIIKFSVTVFIPVTVNGKIFLGDTSMMSTNPNLKDFKNDITIKC